MRQITSDMCSLVLNICVWVSSSVSVRQKVFMMMPRITPVSLISHNGLSPSDSHSPSHTCCCPLIGALGWALIGSELYIEKEIQRHREYAIYNYIFLDCQWHSSFSHLQQVRNAVCYCRQVLFGNFQNSIASLMTYTWKHWSSKCCTLAVWRIRLKK